MMNPYKILGVKKRATAEEIKAAYLKLAKTMHPDAGGGAEDFIRLKAAFDILSDPAARAAFDRTGYVKGDKESELRLVAFDNLCRIWNDMLDQIPPERMPFVDLVAMLREAVQSTKKHFDQGLQKAESLEKRLTKSRDAVGKRLKKKKKGGSANLFFVVIEKRLSEVAAEKAQIKNQLDIVTKALELLDDYEFTPDKEEQEAFSPIGFMIMRR